jgi:predicted small integral membrane protein
MGISTLVVGRRKARGKETTRVDNIRMDLGEVGWGDVDWIGLAQDRNRWRAVLNSVFNLRVP